MSFFPVRVAERRELTSRIVALTLAPMDGRPLPPHAAGAHIDVRTPGGFVRQYSLCGDGMDTSHYRIAVLHEEASRGGSRSIWHGVRAGDLLEIDGPRNHFGLADDMSRAILVGGGIGITPLLAMAHALYGAGVPFELHHATRSRAECAFAAELRLSPFAPRVRMYHDDEGSRIDMDGILWQPQPGTHVYVCGPAGFIDAVLQAGARAGVPPECMHREFFGPSPSTAQVDEAFEVQIASTGEVLEVPPDRSLASVLIAHGLPLMVSCEQGVCGTCMTTVLAGTPDHRDSVLTEEDRARNDTILPCCSRARAGAPRLVLDL